ncbi:hypothetical protein OPV22_030453 [Ensete ventricosum]|uniref:Uncharacterized protein n=1 Tax=Ensete ventricosum TaxID=4639 RepID=A0AAV8QE55_ENSVE|nr:hypothetical protein OPV22_030453 [Ensete ventricosum]
MVPVRRLSCSERTIAHRPQLVDLGWDVPGELVMTQKSLRLVLAKLLKGKVQLLQFLKLVDEVRHQPGQAVEGLSRETSSAERAAFKIVVVEDAMATKLGESPQALGDGSTPMIKAISTSENPRFVHRLKSL